MPHRSWEFRISDIIEAIESVLEYTRGMSYAQFDRDRKTIDAVIRNFIIIGEAASHLSEDFLKNHPDLPWRDMRDMRNIIVHEYFGVDNMVIWETLKKNLPPILPLLRKFLTTGLNQ